MRKVDDRKRQEAIGKLIDLLDSMLEGNAQEFSVRIEANMLYFKRYEAVERESFKLHRQNGK